MNENHDHTSAEGENGEEQAAQSPEGARAADLQTSIEAPEGKQVPAQPELPAPPKKFRRQVLLSFIVAAILIGLPAINGSFYMDDTWFIKRNKSIRSFQNIPRFFYDQSSMYSEKRSYPKVFRPLLYVLWTVQYKTFDEIGRWQDISHCGMRAGGYRFVNFVFHGVTAWLLFLMISVILRRDPFGWTGPPQFVAENIETVAAAAKWAAVFGAALFLVHPLNTETYSYVSTASSGLATLFYILSFYLIVTAHDRREDRLNWKRMALGLSTLIVGFLCKPIIVTLPATLFAYHFLVERHNGLRRPWKSILAQNIPVWVVSLAYVIIRKMILGQVSLTAKPRPLSTHVMTQLEVIWTYIGWLFLPMKQSILHDRPEIQHFYWGTALSIAGLVLLCLLLFLWKNRAAGFGGFFFFISITPTTSVIVLYVLYNEHRVYLPFVGFAVLAAAVGGSWAVKLAARDKHPKLLRNAGIAILAIFAVLAALRNFDYSNSARFYRSAYVANPDYYKAHYLYGYALFRNKRYKEAVKHLKICLEKKPGFSGCMLAYAKTLNAQRRYKEVLKLLEKRRWGGMRAPEIYAQLAYAYKKLGMKDKAKQAEQLRKATSKQRRQQHSKR